MVSLDSTVVGVLGNTSWGTTLAWLAASKGFRTLLWTRTAEEAEEINETRRNGRFLPNLLLPDTLRATADPDEAFASADLIVIAVPSHSMRSNLERSGAFFARSAGLVSASKGLDAQTGSRMTQVIEEYCPDVTNRLCALSGPNLAQEISRGLPAATVVASRAAQQAALSQEILMTSAFRVYTNDDVIGVELGGALKNVIALGAGLSDGLGYGDNAKAGLITRGLAEMTRLAVAEGANSLTLSGLAGLGDLIATCSSGLSRNHYVGEQLGRGRKIQEILASLDHVVEGIDTTRAAMHRTCSLGVEMPITEQVYRVLFEGRDPREAVQDLLARGAKSEFAGRSI